MKKLILAAICGLFLQAAVPPQGCCGPVPPDDGGTTDAADAGHVTTDASTDATVADTARADTAGTDTVRQDSTNTDATVADAGDPCADYYWLEDGREWNCTGAGDFTCAWSVTVVNGYCELRCPDRFWKPVPSEHYAISSNEVTYTSGGNVWTCTPP